MAIATFPPEGLCYKKPASPLKKTSHCPVPSARRVAQAPQMKGIGGPAYSARLLKRQLTKTGALGCAWRVSGGSADGQNPLWNGGGTAAGQSPLWNAEGTAYGQNPLWNAEGTAAGQNPLWDGNRLGTGYSATRQPEDTTTRMSADRQPAREDRLISKIGTARQTPMVDLLADPR